MSPVMAVSPVHDGSAHVSCDGSDIAVIACSGASDDSVSSDS